MGKNLISLCKIGICLTLSVSTSIAAALAPGQKAYELADVIRAVMVDQTKSTPSYSTALRPYNDFKSYVREIKSAEDEDGSATLRGRPKVYTAKIALLVKGKRFIAENPEDQYDWTVRLGGPMVGASDFELKNNKPISQDIETGGADYFRKLGFSLFPVACHNPGGSGGNYSAAYIIVAPGKIQAVLTIEASTGSGGRWYQYGLHLSGMDWIDTPGFQRNPTDPLTPMGDCQIAGKL